VAPWFGRDNRGKPVTEIDRNIAARDSILGSIRAQLAASAPHDAIRSEESSHSLPYPAATVRSIEPSPNGSWLSLAERFKEKLEGVGGHCIIAGNDDEVVAALTDIITALRDTPLRARRVALSDASALPSWLSKVEAGIDDIVTCPAAADLFDYDLGVTTAQAAIAETGTLVLESEKERHRLVSLVPPVHIAIIDAERICQTLGEALANVQGSEAEALSPTITFITGPSRTADIELTLAIGVHGPRELYVIVNNATAKSPSRQDVRNGES
jgi:L-lactate dehydrogenase complex protein LldG